ncbi:unnamed protein product [Adineta steineri]|uniref:NmrA-like family domain-containing protein 1 n=1 Tax=Adineta steineri TaxID=433720 RepID=A0A813RYA0_9BILA|nr:unnamed protein product [Adineta steineri]CAF3970467.1 unnamed protein product [Adineta steineri]
MLSQQRQRKIIIIGGTGKQGSAVINALLPSKSTSSLHLLTLTRNLQSKKALELKEREVELVQADLDEATVDQLANVFQGADGLFIAQAISDKEVEQGYKIINAAEKAGVKQVVYSSVGRAHDAPDVPHFHSKFLIEEYLKKSSIKYYTILRPFSFMENLFYATRYDKEKINFWTDPQTIVNHIACEDIGKVAAQAFLNPEKYNHQSIELAGDTMNGNQLCETFSKVLERPMKYVKMDVRDESTRLMIQWIENSKFVVDVKALKEEYGLNLKSVEDFMRENRDVFG